MGEIINTDGSETQPFLSPDMKYLFFTRFNKNESDIYWIDASIIDELKRKSDILKED
jgi:Tol biopolymer transport system component